MNCPPILAVYIFEAFLAGGGVLGFFLLVREWLRESR
jgi:hypothetical protein